MPEKHSHQLLINEYYMKTLKEFQNDIDIFRNDKKRMKKYDCTKLASLENLKTIFTNLIKNKSTNTVPVFFGLNHGGFPAQRLCPSGYP